VKKLEFLNGIINRLKGLIYIALFFPNIYS
jgi:hypothetical protein